MIGKSVAYFKSQGKEVIYDAEHFFDGYKANPDYALATLRQPPMAERICWCCAIPTAARCPGKCEEIVATVAAEIDTPLGIHTHDDSGCGVANTLAAVRAGAVHIQGTINGYGERVGNANLCSVIPELAAQDGQAASCRPRTWPA